jgi:hypothetical protein
MGIWMIGSQYSDEGYLNAYPLSIEDVQAAYGYFATKEEAVKKAALLMEPLNSGYLEYVAHNDASNAAHQKRYAEELIDFEILKAAGRTPKEPYKPYLTQAEPFERWHTMRFAAIEVPEGSLDINEIL